MLDRDPVHDQSLDRPLHVEDPELRACGSDGALVGDLPAGLGVERGTFQDHLRDLAFFCRSGQLAVADDTADGPAPAHDPPGRQADLLVPDADGLVVAGVDGGPDPLPVQPAPWKRAASITGR